VPELPEVESVRRGLEPHVVGRVVARVRSVRLDFALRESGEPASPRDLLQGTTIESLHRRGKLMWAVGGNGGVVAMHLGMSGEMRIVPPEQAVPAEFRGPRSHVHVMWALDDSTRWLFRDPRRFGGVWCYASHAAFEAAHLSRLGPDALDITPEELAGGLAGSRRAGSTRAIKAALLDQSVVAGVGNIYADEALFEVAMHPARRAGSLRTDDIGRLTAAIHGVLGRALVSGGSTLRDYRDASGGAGNAQLGHRAYGRVGLPCVRCGATMKQTTIAQRTTTYCATCQHKQ